MAKLLFSILFALISFMSSAQTSEILTNASITEMVELEFESDLIISKIESTPSKFETSIEALKALKNSGVSSNVIAAMVYASKKEAVNNQKTGIYFLDANGAEQSILPTAFSGTKTRTLASGLTYGIASGKIKSVLNNSNSKNIIQVSDSLSFMFYFLPFNDTQRLATDWWFRVTTSPNEFVLVALDVKKNTREIESGKVNLWVGSDTGAKNENVIPFEITDAGEGKYIVTPAKPLPKGEYCFFYQGTIPQGGYTNQSVFDFSAQ